VKWRRRQASFNFSLILETPSWGFSEGFGIFFSPEKYSLRIREKLKEA